MKKIIIALICTTTISTYAQVNIKTSGNYATPSYLIDYVLIGDGVLSSNHNYVGDPSQIGFFSDSLGLIGMDSGFVLSTGGVDSIGNTGVDTLFGMPQSYGLATDLFGSGDADLLTIANSVPAMIGQTFSVSSTHDVAILEFDFVPSSDTVRFNYVFASEEYLDFVNSSFNDVFAFFISGPGITGPYSSPTGFPGGAINIAEVPNSNPSLPITVSTVNNLTNSQYYNHDSLAQVSAFNGYTDVFTATAVVTPCETYHIKLAIADGSDGTLDSGVFFEAGSFNSVEPGAPNAQINTTDVLCNGDSSGIATICVQGGTGPYTIDWNGQDPNALAAGTYSVTVTDALGSIASTNFTIAQPNPLTTSITQIANDLNATVSGGTPNYNYQWLFNGIVIDTNALITPAQNGDYTVVVTDANGCVDTAANFNVNNIPTGINELIGKELIIYPNPFANHTIIKFLNEEDKLIDLALYNPMGQLVKNLKVKNNNDAILLEKGGLSKGIYLLVVQTNKYTSKSKLIIE